jgi:hypothetical protein
MSQNRMQKRVDCHKAGCTREWPATNSMDKGVVVTKQDAQEKGFITEQHAHESEFSQNRMNRGWVVTMQDAQKSGLSKSRTLNRVGCHKQNAQESE